MTTIIYDHKNKQIACDSMVTIGSRIASYSFNKFIRVGDKTWFICGSPSWTDVIVNLKNGDKIPDYIKDVGVLMLTKGSLYYCVEDDGYFAISKCDYNIGVGSGRTLAIAALDHGKTARHAIEYAATKDCYTGGDIRVFCTLTGREIDQSIKIPGGGTAYIQDNPPEANIPKQ